MEGISCIGMDLGVGIMILDGLRGVLILSGELLAYRRDRRGVEVKRGYYRDDPADHTHREEHACDSSPASRYIFIWMYVECLTNPISLHA